MTHSYSNLNDPLPKAEIREVVCHRHSEGAGG